MSDVADVRVLTADEKPTPIEALREIAAWLRHKVEHAPVATRGESEACGHPHSWAGKLIPDWDMRQKLDLVSEAIQVNDDALADLTALHPAAEWTEADGVVLWWRLLDGAKCLVCHGTAPDTEKTHIRTHWSRRPQVEFPAMTKEAK